MQFVGLRPTISEPEREGAVLAALVSLLGAIRVKGPHEQFIELKVVAGGLRLERAPKVGGDSEIERLQGPLPGPILMYGRSCGSFFIDSQYPPPQAIALPQLTHGFLI
jgi:hypothetical protein